MMTYQADGILASHTQPVIRDLAVLLGVPVDNLDMDEALDRIEQFVQVGRRTGRTHQIATANVDFLVKAAADDDLRAILWRADLVTADGMPVVWGAKLLGVESKGRVAGSDMVPLLAQRAAYRGYSIFLLGAAPGVAQKAAEILTAQYPGLKIAGVISPPVGPVEKMDHAIVEAIQAAKPDILLVAFGNPKQEKWIAMYGKEVGVPVMMGIGGTLDFITGTTTRAPKWMHGIGLEWVYRLLQEPRRLFKRYFTDLMVFNSAFASQYMAFKLGWPTKPPKFGFRSELLDQSVLLRVQGDFTSERVHAFINRVQRALAESRHVVIDLGRVTRIDSAAIGALIQAANLVESESRKLVLANVPAKIMAIFQQMNLDEFFMIFLSNDEAYAHLTRFFCLKDFRECTQEGAMVCLQHFRR